MTVPSLILLWILAVRMDSTCGLTAWSREQLTMELGKLNQKLQQLEERQNHADHFHNLMQQLGEALGEKLNESVAKLGERLGEQLAEGVERLGEKLTEGVEKMGQNLTEGIKTLGVTLGEKQVEGVDRLGEELAETLAEGVKKMGQELAEGVKSLGVTVGEKQAEGVRQLGERMLEGVGKQGKQLTDGLEKLGATLAGKEDVCLRPGPNIPDPTSVATCVDVKEYDATNSVHTLTVSNRHVTVFCDQTTAGGGWTVVQRRMNGQMDFYRNWTDYDAGFGDLRYEFWLGLENIYRLTSSQSHELRVDLEDWDGSTAYAEYSQFSISGPDDFYRLSVSGYTGTAGDSINVAASDQNQNIQQFSTPDQDHDNSAILHCAKGNNHGGWWFNACGYANLNGRYGAEGDRGWEGVVWYHWKNDNRSLKHVEMKIRPRA